MDSIKIVGGKPLEGSICIQGSKNAALPLMAAAILHEGITVLHHCPQIADVKYMEAILKSLGARLWWEKDSLFLDTRQIVDTKIPRQYGDKMRSSIILMGSLLGRMGKATIPYPGGCVIGRRPIDFHLKAMKSLGATIEEQDGLLHCHAPGMTGSEIIFPKASVGASQNAILASVCAKGETRLYGCAKEPEVVWLCRFLDKMGARIDGIGSPDLIIHGVSQFKDIEFTVPADRIVAGTYLCACAITRGYIEIENPPIVEMDALLKTYLKMGGQYEVNGGKLTLCGNRELHPLSYLETEVYPGFPTDMQSPLMAVLTKVSGKSHIRETVFEDRYKVASQLTRMGARIVIDGRDAMIEGVSGLTGSNVFAEELRGGAALVVAGLGATGTSCILNRHFIERGYEHICEDIASLGGIISKD